MKVVPSKTTVEPIDLVISFDTTGSMYPCLTQVRRYVDDLCKEMFKSVPGIRIGIIAHGDYCDVRSTYVTKLMDLTHDQKKICDFIKTVPPTGGGDAPECYELVLHEARTKMSWSAGKSKIVLMIGDDVPHHEEYDHARYGYKGPKVDWKNEAGLLSEAGISVYAVHAMPSCRRHSKSFYQEVSRLTGGIYIPLDQFAIVSDMIMAVALKQEGGEALAQFELSIEAKGAMNRSMDQIFVSITGRKAKFEPEPEEEYHPYRHSSSPSAPRKSSSTGSSITRYSRDFGTKVGKLEKVPASRFQVMDVDKDCAIQQFVTEQGLTFAKGKGFYEFSDRTVTSKPVKVQKYKEIVIRRKSTGEFFTGNKAREMVGLPIGTDAVLTPSSMRGYVAYIQSTSNNRKLLGGTTFLYEVPDWDRVEEESEELATV